MRSLLVALIAGFVGGCGPSDPAQEVAEGRKAAEVADFLGAIGHFEAALELAPHDVDAIVALAETRLELGEIPAAHAVLDKVADAAKDDVDVLFVTAKIAFLEKRYDDSLKAYLKIANDSANEKPVRSEAFAGVGVIELARENLDASRIAFLKSMRLDRRNASARYHLGLLYRNGFGFLSAALEQYESYVCLQQTADRRVQRVQRTDIPEVKEAIARAIATIPGAATRNSTLSADAIKRAEAFAKKGRLDSARSAYQEAYKADPLSFPAAISLAKLSEKDPTSQLRYYTAACQLSPSSISTAISAGDLAYRLGQYATAAKLYSRAIAANPTDLTAIDGHIRSLRKLGKTKAAADYQEYRNFLSSRK